MLLPDEAVRIIQMQRSNYGKKNNKKHVKKMYNIDVEKEFNGILQYLGKVKKIVDIGCGLAGVSIQLAHFYEYPELYLVDKNQIANKIKYGYHKDNCFYNSFDLLKSILEMNYIENYFLIDCDDFKEIENVDLIISLLACGFHFPLSFYIDRIFNSLSENGVFICDIRSKVYAEEIKVIKLRFKNISEIKTDNSKTIRICAKEKICPV